MRSCEFAAHISGSCKQIIILKLHLVLFLFGDASVLMLRQLLIDVCKNIINVSSKISLKLYKLRNALDCIVVVVK